MSENYSRKLLNTIIRAHVFLALAFIAGIVIVILSSNKNVHIYFELEFYLVMFKKPMLWILYIAVVASFAGAALIGSLISKFKGDKE